MAKHFLNVLFFLVRIPFELFLKMTYRINENYILFDSKPDFADNCRALYNYLNKIHPEYSFIWLVDNANKYNKEGLKNTTFVKKNSKYHKGLTLKALYYISKSRYIFYSHGIKTVFLKSLAGQTVVNVWHGCGFKDNGGQGKLMAKSPFDYALVPGNAFVESKTKFWGCNAEQILTTGYPRYDWIFERDENSYEFIKNRSNGKKAVLWMPTYRKSVYADYPEAVTTEEFDFPLFKSIDEMKIFDGWLDDKNVFILVKRHPSSKV